MDQPTQLRDQSRMNIADVAELVAEMFKPCLGPVGRAKLVEDKDGIWFSDDPSLILTKVGLQHPAAKALSEAATSISGSFGDGACSFLILVAELLKGAGGLMKSKTHPNRIVNGWRIALDHCLDAPSLSVIEASDRSSLTSVARTVLSESTSQDCEKLAPLIVDAVLSIPAAGQIDLGNFSVERVVGGAIGESFFMKGVAIPHELGDPFGPRSIRDARIALVKGEINERKPETWRADTKIQITGAFGISAVRAARYSFLTGLAKNVARSGATVLFIEKGIDPIAIEYLSRRGIMVVRRVVIEGLQRLALATGAQIVYDLQAISSADLGFAGLVESRTMNNEEWVFVEGCRNPKAATFVVKGENEILLHSTVRLVRRSVKTVREAQRSRSLVYGGGAWEMSLVQKLRRLSSRYEGRQQLAIDGFADALEAIPATLAKNAGMDVIATVAALRASHAEGDARVGIDSRRRILADMGRLGVLDPFSVKRKILLTAFGVGAMLIRIDSMILQHQLSGEKRILKEREKHTDPERIEKRRRDYGGMEKLDWPRWRPSRETRIVNR